MIELEALGALELGVRWRERRAEVEYRSMLREISCDYVAGTRAQVRIYDSSE